MATRHTELYIIEPAERTNMIINPSFEDATTGYTAFGTAVSIARTATYQRRGTYGLDITTASDTASGVFYDAIAFTSGTNYVGSVDVKDVTGQGFNLYFCDTAGNAVGTATEWTGDGNWKRPLVSYSATASANFRLYLTRDSVASTTHFYTDGWQVEAGSAASTYLDGDMVGFHRFRADYGWNGTAHASTSWRTAKTRSGGTLLRVRDYAGLVGVIGLGMPPMVNNSLPSSAGGAFYQSTVTQPREFTILLNFSDAAGLSGLYADRAQIVDAIKPDNVPADEPIVLRWELEDTSGVVQSETLDLVCTYSGGLEYDASDPNVSQLIERAAVTFTAHDPMFKQDGNAGADLGFGTSVANAAYLLYRTPTGTWTSAGVHNGDIKDIAIAQDGKVYATGSFTSIGGVAANYIAYWDGSWHAMGTGLAAQGNCLAIAPDNLPYVGGAFATANGVTVNNIAKWTGSTFSALGATGVNGAVNDIVLDGTGNLYACGAFTTAAGTTVNYVAKWTGSAWAAMTTAIASAGNGLAILGSRIYLCGAATGYVKYWSGTAWVDTGLAAQYEVGKLAAGADGVLYWAGQYDGSLQDYAILASYTGATWNIIATGPTTAAAGASLFYSIIPRPGGGVYGVGSLISLNGVTFPSVGIQYSAGTLTPIDLELGVSNHAYTIAEQRDGTLWIGGAWSTTPIVSPTVAAANNGSSKAYPVIRFIGPGTFWQLKNYTTGKTITFTGLTLQAGETAIFDLRPGRVRFTSDWRGGLLKYIQPGSDLDLFLISGSNNISCYITGSTAATKAYMSYQGQYWSIDGAAR